MNLDKNKKLTLNTHHVVFSGETKIAPYTKINIKAEELFGEKAKFGDIDLPGDMNVLSVDIDGNIEEVFQKTVSAVASVLIHAYTEANMENYKEIYNQLIDGINKTKFKE